MHPTSVTPYLWADPHYYESEISLIQSFLRPGDLFVDVGSNVGILTIAGALRVGPSGKVVSVEAHPRIYSYLLENLVCNNINWVQTFNCLLGQVEGKALFSDGNADTANCVLATGKGIYITMQRLDQLLTPKDVVTLLKIDVEGYEYAVLRGADKILRQTGCIWFESYEKNYIRYGYKLDEIRALLREYGFSLYRWNELCWNPLPANHTSVNCENLLALRDCQFGGRRIHNLVCAT